jgi:hypothetical protein
MRDGIEEIRRCLLVAVVLCLLGGICQVQADEKGLLSHVLVYAGRSYHGLKSAEYVSYDVALRSYDDRFPATPSIAFIQDNDKVPNFQLFFVLTCSFGR